MIFLKRIEAVGFKSYAQLNKINLDYPFIGIVGSNGSGKTNIVDAIRWVLGETSAKQLRGETNNDIIFYGSNIFNQSEEANVKLIFDNSKRLINFDADEVSVQRILKRNSGSSDYYLNDKLVKRSDVTNLFLDTGLSKGSLGIISQGTVQNFVDSKPEDRRKIFEEAAGVSHYTKTKQERLNELKHVEENLNTLLLSQKLLNKQINELKKQAETAEKYLNVKQDLEKYELFNAKKKYQFYNSKINELNQELKTKKEEYDTLQDNLIKSNSNYQIVLNKKQEQEELVNKLTNNKISLLEEVNSLQQQKTQYEINLQNQLSSNDINVKINALKQKLIDLNVQLQNWNKSKDNEQRIVAKLNNQINVLKQEVSELQSNLNAKNIKYQTLKNNLQYIINKQQSDLKNQTGVKVILDNKNTVPGLIGQLKDLISSKNDKYNVAIELSLNKNLNSLVVNTIEDAKLGIEFLKKNHCGVASFMPLNGIKPASVASNTLLIAKNFDGFIGTANELINTDEKYEIVLQTLIGAILIVDNLNTATMLAKAINYSYKIISLDGEIINRGGMMIGGSKNNINVSFNLKEQQEQLEQEIETLKKQLQDDYAFFQNKQDAYNNCTNDLNSHEVSFNTANNQIDKISQEFNETKSSLLALNADTPKLINEAKNKIVDQLSKLQIKKNDIEIQLQNATKNLSSTNALFQELSNNINKSNFAFNQLQTNINTLEKNLLTAKTIIDNAVATVNQYKYTIEYVLENVADLDIIDSDLLEQISSLKAQLESFGPINMNAVNELQEKEASLSNLNNNIQDVQEAEKNLNDVINSLDKEVSKLFKNKILEINKTLPQVFGQLFKNGVCELAFTNPDDLLTTGIEVFVKSTGKQIKRLNVLSGGEKAIISLSILITILKTSKFPLVILDEAESALDPKNAEAFAQLIRSNSDFAQFVVVTHRKETMVKCHKLLGATMQDGVTTMYNLTLKEQEI